MAKKSNVRRRARRDVRVANQPLFNELDRVEDQAKDQLEEDQGRVGTIYDALAKELAGLQQPGYAQIGSDLTAQLGELTSMLGSSGPAGELAAAGNLFGGIGAGGLTQLASDRSRNLAYGTSVKRQAAVERATLRKNYLEDFRDLVDELSQRRLDVRGDMQAQILARIDELRDRKFQHRLAKDELAIREKIADRDFGFQNKQFRHQRNQDNAFTDFTIGAAEQKMIGQLRNQIGGLKDRLGTVKGALGDFPSTGQYTPEQAQQYVSLTQRKKRIRKKITNKRRRIQKIKKD